MQKQELYSRFEQSCSLDRGKAASRMLCDLSHSFGVQEKCTLCRRSLQLLRIPLPRRAYIPVQAILYNERLFLDVKSDWFKEQSRFHVTSRTCLGIGRSQHASQFRNPRYQIMACEILSRAKVRKVFHQKKNKETDTLLLLACVSVSFNIPYSAPQRNSNVLFPSDQDSLTTSVLLIIKRAGTHRRRLGQTAQVVTAVRRHRLLCS